MNFFNWLFNRNTAPRRFVKVAGESFYQDALTTITGGKTPDGHNMQVQACVIPEDNNPHDPNAVRIEINGYKVGYLPRRKAVEFRKRSQAQVTCNAEIVGGWDRGRGDTGYFGVRLDLTLNQPHDS